MRNMIMRFVLTTVMRVRSVALRLPAGMGQRVGQCPLLRSKQQRNQRQTQTDGAQSLAQDKHGYQRGYLVTATASVSR